MKDEEFMENLVALAKDKLDMFNSLAEETSSFWAEIRDCRYEWEVNRNEALALRGLAKSTVLEAFDKWLSPNTQRRMLVVQAICAPQNGEDAAASLGCPDVDPSKVSSFVDDCVNEFHQVCKQQTWGKIYT
jgi:secreted Zn-dependent insulinase-like peptidase